MVQEKVMLEALKNAMKLNSYEAKIYTALLSRGISSASELADISKVPRSRCYDVLEGLEKKGFVFMKIGKPIKYIAIEPEEVLETIKKQTKIEENRMISLMDSVKETEMFNELKDLYTNGVSYVNNNEISTSIVGRQNINLFLKDMLGRASRNILIHTTEQGAKRKSKLLRKSVNKKIKIDMNVHNAKMLQKNSGFRLVKVDEDELLFFTSPEEADPEHEAAIWVKSRFVADTMKSLIE